MTPLMTAQRARRLARLAVVGLVVFAVNGCLWAFLGVPAGLAFAPLWLALTVHQRYTGWLDGYEAGAGRTGRRS